MYEDPPFLFGWSAGPVVWTSYLLFSVFMGFLCYNFCYKEFLGFCKFFMYFVPLFAGIFVYSLD